jgi:hypothetical protein
MCEESEGTGFNWSDGAWKFTKFTRDKLVIRKAATLPPDLSVSGGLDLCDPALRKPNKLMGEDFYSASACYGISDFGEKPNFEWCTEYYLRTGGQWRFNQVSCETLLGPKIAFDPKGPFIASWIHGIIMESPASGTKDSLKISHGKCAVIG